VVVPPHAAASRAQVEIAASCRVLTARFLQHWGGDPATEMPDRILSGVADDPRLGSHLRLGTPVRVV
jgi:hypothetical protein